MGLVFSRMYVDIPTDTKARLVQRAADLGLSQKALVAQLIESECGPEKSKRKARAKRSK